MVQPDSLNVGSKRCGSRGRTGAWSTASRAACAPCWSRVRGGPRSPRRAWSERPAWSAVAPAARRPRTVRVRRTRPRPPWGWWTPPIGWVGRSNPQGTAIDVVAFRRCSSEVSRGNARVLAARHVERYPPLLFAEMWGKKEKNACSIPALGSSSARWTIRLNHLPLLRQSPSLTTHADCTERLGLLTAHPVRPITALSLVPLRTGMGQNCLKTPPLSR
jgi:hypothetical protein